MKDIQHALQIVSRAFWEIYFKRQQLTRALAVHITAVLLFGLLTEMKVLVDSYVYIAIVPAIYSWTLLVVNTHRIILLDTSDLPKWGEYKFSMRELKFLLFGSAIGLLSYTALIFSVIPEIGKYICMVGAAYITGRFSLIFPATAIDQDWSLSNAWKSSESHQFLMMLIVFIIPLLIDLPGSLLANTPYSTTIIYILWPFSTILIIASLSLAFEDIKNDGTTN